jgi:hypothetical protein
VLLSIEEYRRLTGGEAGARSIVDMLAMPVTDGTADIDFDPPRLNLQLRPTDLD